MLKKIKLILGLTDDLQDDLLKEIIKMTESRLQNLLGGIPSVPDSLAFIVKEVTIARFNRIGSEGVSSHSVDGESMTWSEDDFAPFMDDIQAYLDAQDDPPTKRGRVKFI